MQQYGFEPRFPPTVLAETAAVAELPGARREARDCTKLLWSSIDNWDSMDLDQIEYCEAGPGDEIRCRVAIADVDLFVGKGSATDRHAAHNGFSVYTGVVTYPMLPDRLSKGASSLLPGGDRMAVVIEYAVLPDGSVRPGDLYPARVRNHAKLVYEKVGDWLEGTGPIPPAVRDTPGLEAQLRLQLEAMRRLRERRHDQGALELDTVEAEPLIEDGVVRDLVVQRQNLARQLIEEFMVAANGTMVAYLERAGLPMLQRVVRVPRYWDRIVETAAQYGEVLPADPDAKALAAFLLRRRAADPDRFPDLSLTVIKLLGPGEYLALEPGSRVRGPLQPRRHGLHPRDRPEPAVPRPGQPAACRVRLRGNARPLQRGRARGPRGLALGPREGDQEGRAVRAQGRCRRPPPRPCRRDLRGARHRGLAQGDLGPGHRPAGRGTGDARRGGAGRRQPRPRPAPRDRCVPGLHRLRVRSAPDPRSPRRRWSAVARLGAGVAPLLSFLRHAAADDAPAPGDMLVHDLLE